MPMMQTRSWFKGWPRWPIAWLLVAAAALALATSQGCAAASRVILVVGDSISAGYGLPPGTGWTQLLTERLMLRKLDWRVVNASISGDTTSGGRARLPALLAREKPALVVIELGGNDGLRGSDLATMRANLTAMVDMSKAAHAAVLLVGMRLPPNYGNAYVSRFAANYVDVSKASKVPLVPFLFAGFAERTDLFQADGVHPKAESQLRLLDNVWPYLAPLLSARP